MESPLSGYDDRTPVRREERTMSSSSALTIGITVVVVLAAVLLVSAGRRRDRRLLPRETARADRSASPFLAAERPLHGAEYERQATRTASSTALEPARERIPSPWVPADPDTIGVTRRQFFNRSVVAMMGLGFSGFGAATLAFLWPTLASGFGSKVTAGNLDDLLGGIKANRQPMYFAEGRFHISPYPKEALAKAKRTYSSAVLPGLEAGVLALYQKCPHLGCRVPFCTASQWFECGCHGSQYNRVGEKKGRASAAGHGPVPGGGQFGNGHR